MTLAATRPPAKCNGCQVNRVAWVKPRVDYCYECLPGGPFVPPACRTCGTQRYFSEGLCERCHPGGPKRLDSCRGCPAWGVDRSSSWLCGSCRWWQTHYPLGECDYCRRETRVGVQGACRLCLEQARLVQEPGRALDLVGVNQRGQQLFFADMAIARRKIKRLTPDPREGNAVRLSPVGWRQLALFTIDPDPAVVRDRALARDMELRWYCDDIVREHATRYGWSKRQRNDVTRSLRLLQILQETPGAKIRATDVLELPHYGGNIVSTLDVLGPAGLYAANTFGAMLLTVLVGCLVAWIVVPLTAAAVIFTRKPL